MPLHCVQLTEQVRHQMESTLKTVYGIDLDVAWNKKVTKSWDKAQTLVTTSDTAASYMIFHCYFLLFTVVTVTLNLLFGTF